ncbi:NAD(P)H-dependent oxidoreductase [Providencia rettgeri]|uniref:FMN-dependent NADH-azoreductase n=1 Tax=Providencia manganoxydans TaxID=2923283 RepID=UPI00292755C3|nr:NAD(P)H-dependent oxidoreductase [Providencia rettgeri]
MKEILFIQSSINGANSQTKRILNYFERYWIKNHENTSIIKRNLVKNSLPIMDEEVFSAYYSTPLTQQSEKQKKAIEISNELIDEIKRSELIVMTAPMYNLSISSQLKNYFDLIIRAGLTFSYINNERVGLLKNKKALILTSQGGLKYDKDMDYLNNYLRDLLNFVGIEDSTFIGVEGVAMKPNNIELEHSNAEKKIMDFINNY